MTHDSRTLILPALAAATLVVALAAGGAWAQAPVVADDVQCSPDPCVDTSDIAPGAVRAKVIANGSIGRNKLAKLLKACTLVSPLSKKKPIWPISSSSLRA